MGLDYEFRTDAYPDEPETVRGHFNELAGKAVLEAVLAGLAAREFETDEVFAEDWGWCGFARRGADRYLVGSVTYDHPDDGPAEEAGPVSHRVFLEADDPRPFRWQMLVPFLPTPPPPHVSPTGAVLDAEVRAVLSELEGVTELRAADG